MGMNREHNATVDNWLLAVSGTGHLRIEGIVRGHHRLPDGPVVTSRIVAFEKRDDRLVAVTPTGQPMYGPRTRRTIWAMRLSGTVTKSPGLSSARGPCRAKSIFSGASSHARLRQPVDALAAKLALPRSA